MNILDIKTPADIKNLSIDELKDLASQMRKGVLNRTSKIGGHVGPNLGDAEAVLAMHYVFDAPKDKIVFDVSHQDFPHKMLTGRACGYFNEKDFSKVGEYTSPKESPEFDIFYAGHTSPSLSLCTGLMKARELQGGKYNIVAFIGDGALSGGEAFEGLDAAGALQQNLIVIFNDNQMAIAENHGGMYPGLRQLLETNGTAENNIFKNFGFKYVFVKEGNDIESLIKAFREVKDSPVPVVVHINTQKGEGYVPAEEFREEFHYSMPYQVATGDPESATNNPSYPTTLRDYLLKKVKENPNLLIVTSSTPGSFGFHKKQRDEAGKQFIDVGIAEQTAVSVMAGAARAGTKVVYPIVSSFLQRAYDQLLEDWAMDESPAVLVTLATGINGIKDLTHLGFWDIPYISSIPEIVYLAPTNEEEFIAMMDWAVAQDKYKVAVREPTYSFERAEGPVDKDYSDLNKFKVMHQGSEVAIIGAGDFYKKAKDAAALLKAKGIDATLINPRFVSDVDKELLRRLPEQHKLIVTLEDGSIDGGFGQKVAAAVSDLPIKVMIRGLEKKFVDRYNPADLEKEYRLLPEQIVSDIEALLK